MNCETETSYPTQELLKGFVPVRDIIEELNIDESTIMEYVNSKRVLYALLKDPKGHKRIPHVHKSQLIETMKEVGESRESSIRE